MSRPILTVDAEEEIVLEEPRGGAVLRTVLLLAAALGVRLLLPGYWIAPAALGILALWTLTGALRIHRLRLDLDRRRYRYRRGWLFAPPRCEGDFADVAGVFLERHEPEGGLEVSRLRSRHLRLEIPACGEQASFLLGFPMGPRVAEEKAADYARRLGVEVVDRTTGPETESEVPLGTIERRSQVF